MKTVTKEMLDQRRWAVLDHEGAYLYDDDSPVNLKRLRHHKLMWWRTAKARAESLHPDARVAFFPLLPAHKAEIEAQARRAFHAGEIAEGRYTRAWRAEIKRLGLPPLPPKPAFPGWPPRPKRLAPEEPWEGTFQALQAIKPSKELAEYIQAEKSRDEALEPFHEAWAKTMAEEVQAERDLEAAEDEDALFFATSNDIEPEEEPAPYKAIDGDALLATVFPEQVFITEGSLKMAAGAYIVAGKPKHGKSWLTMGLAVAGVTGEEYVGTTTAPPGEAIYIACDDSSQRRFQTRLQAFKPAGSIRDLTVITEWAAEARSSIDVLDALVADRPDLRLVAIDTLSAFRKSLRADNPYQQEYDEVKALNDWAHRHGVVLLIVHHLRKGKVDPADPFESISGTLGMQGAVDGMVVLSRNDDHHEMDQLLDRKLAGLWFRGRDLEHEVDLGVELRDGRWRVIGTTTDVFAATTQRLILDVLRGKPGEWMTAKEIHALGEFDCKADTIKRTCSRMARKRLIQSHHGAIPGKGGEGGGGFRWVQPPKLVLK